MTRTLSLIGLVGVFGLCAYPLHVRAFSDPGNFALPAQQAGGGGRYFTGSPADGYTCKACHEGGQEPQLLITGLPPEGYVPGHAYEIVVAWPIYVDKFSAAVELSDMHGRPAGSLRLPPLNEMQAPEFCEPASDQVPAASLNDAGNGRQVITIPDCGAMRLRFLWTAPPGDVGQVWFAGSAVASNGKGDTQGDGVSDFGRALAFAGGGTAMAGSATTGCSAAFGRERSAWLLPVFVLYFGRRRWLRRIRVGS
jgi:hypothetical protein